MSMTPERIKEIKQLISKHKHFDKRLKTTKNYNEANSSVIRLDHIESRAFGFIPELLAALEESQQQVEEQRDINEGVRVMARDWHAEAKHWKAEHERSRGELAEAQQTIALKDEALRDYEHNRKIYQQELRAAYDTTGIPSR